MGLGPIWILTLTLPPAATLVAALRLPLPLTLSLGVNRPLHLNHAFQNNIQNYVAMSIWKTPTTAQCSVPTTEAGGENKRLHGLFTLHVIQTFSNGDPSATKKIVDILIFDSTCQTCDEDTNTCVLRVRLSSLIFTDRVRSTTGRLRFDT